MSKHADIRTAAEAAHSAYLKARERATKAVHALEAHELKRHELEQDERRCAEACQSAFEAWVAATRKMTGEAA